MALKNDKSLGQHWLNFRPLLDEIAEIAASEDANSSKTPLTAPESRLCLEIGPGLGTLTSSLLRVFPRVLAIEFDQKLAANLPKSFPGKNLQVENCDFLKFNLDSIKEPYVVAGNIPYYITSPIITKLLSAKHRPDRIVLLIQKEVAERIAAQAGKHTVLSLSVQNHAKVTLGPVVGRELFTPPPKVDSQVIILEPLKNPIIPDATFNLIKRGFSAPRKKLLKNLGQLKKEDLVAIFLKLGLSKDARPADLSLEQWHALGQAITSSN